MRITLIHNPKAGGGDTDRDELISWIRDAGHEVTCHSPKKEKWAEALEDPGDLVAVAGGDGTVGKVARHLTGRLVPVALIPTGTANNTARTLGIAGRPIPELIAGWATAARVPFDVAEVRGPWGTFSMLESAGVGLVAEVIAELRGSGRFKKLDEEEQLVAIRKLMGKRLKKYASRQLTMSLDGEEISGEYILAEAMNTPFVGPNLYLAPDANVGDGLLHLVLVTEAEREALLEHLAGEREVMPRLPVRGGKRWDVGLADLTAHIDSETWPDDASEKAERMTVEAAAERLEMLVPGGR